MLNPTNGVLEAEFKSFHGQNPDVYLLLVKLAREAKSKGKTKAGIKMLFEVVRWEKYLTTTTSDFKLNNNYTSRYARLIMQTEPDLKDFFNVRSLHT